jgi:hypothetical protein
MKKYFLLIACLLGITISYAQSVKPEVIATAGDYFKNSNYSMSWTLGECITETYSSANNKLTQGFQQSNYTITAVNQLAIGAVAVKAFPNPTTDLITVSIEITNCSQNEYSIELFDLQGKQLIGETMEEKSKQLDMTGFANGTYFLKVSDRGKNILQNFKILKN